jgi:threonine synthase
MKAEIRRRRLRIRASAVGVVKALEKNTAQITCASTGNAASSVAGSAAAAGVPATIFVPARAPEAKVARSQRSHAV